MDSNNNYYNVRNDHRRLKGKFILQKRKLWREYQLNSVKKIKLSESPALNLSNLSGRRVVELNLLAEELWCKECEIPLSLRKIMEEKFMGLASILKITMCKMPKVF